MLHKIRSIRNTVKGWWEGLHSPQQAWLQFTLCVLGTFFVVIGVLSGGGCRSKQPATCPAPQVVQQASPNQPSIIQLSPGQTAMILDDVVVYARVPFNGNELYVGDVRLEKGTLVSKPRTDVSKPREEQQ